MSRRAIVLSTLALGLLAASAGAEPCTTLTKLGNFFTPGQTDLFGTSVSMSFGGLTPAPLMAVGRPNADSGAGQNAGGFTVYRKVNGWSIMFDAINNSGQAGEQLGWSIGLADPYLIAGAPSFNANQGRARIFRRPTNGGGFSLDTDVVATFNVSGARFGEAVAVSAFGDGTPTGPWCIVGAPLHDFHGEADAGAVFFYVRTPDTIEAPGEWTEVYVVRGGDFLGAANDRRGSAVAISQTSPFAAYGSPNHDQNGSATDHGAVYVVTRLANGLPSGQPKYITPPSPEAHEHFGAAVAIEGGVLVVGAPDEDMTLQEGGFQQQAINGGAIYIYHRNAQTTNWDFVSKLRSPTPTNQARFGAALSTDGTRIIVNEPGTQRAYVFTSTNGTWTYQAAFSSPESPVSGGFGNAVGVRENDLAIADSVNDHTGTADAGAVFTTTMAPDAVTGDLCSNPIPVPAGDYIGCTANATASGFQATTCGNPTGQGPDVFFIFQPECSGNAIFDTFGSAFDTVLSVHTVCPNIFGNDTIACNDDASFAPPNHRASLVTFNFTGGETYLIRVSGYSGASGQFTLRHLYTYGVSNDSCATATNIGLGTVNFDTCAATNSAFGTPCAGMIFNDVWYRFVAPQAGTYRYTVCSTDPAFDTVLAIYSATQLNCPTAETQPIACNDDFIGHPCNPLQSRIIIHAVAGQSMRIRIGGYNGGDYGAASLTIDQPFICNADFNGDGALDPDDLGDYINCYFATPPCNQADFNADGSVDPDDLGDFINAYFAGC